MVEVRNDAFTAEQAALLEKYRHLIRNGFHGTFLHGLDSKGRMIVPVAFREALGDKFYVCLTPDFKAIALYPESEWQLYYCTLLELAEKGIRLTGSKSKIIHEPLPGDDPTQRQPVIDLAKEKLEWHPTIDLEDGLQRTITYFREIL